MYTVHNISFHKKHGPLISKYYKSSSMKQDSNKHSNQSKSNLPDYHMPNWFSPSCQNKQSFIPHTAKQTSSNERIASDISHYIKDIGS